MSKIIDRRSCRSYKKDAIEKEKLDLIIKAGLNHPTGCNKQPCDIVVCQDAKILEQIDKACTEKCVAQFGEGMFKLVESLGPGACKEQKILYGAPCVVFIFETERNTIGTIQYDVGTMGMNMMMQADELGIGGCFVGMVKFAGELIQELFEMKGKNVHAGICLGYPTGEHKPTPKEILTQVKYV